MRFGTWNVRRPYWSGALTTVVREMTRYKLDLVGVQEVRRDKRGIVRARIYIFSMEMEMKMMKWESFFFFFLHHRTVSAVKTVEFTSNRLSYIVLRGH